MNGHKIMPFIELLDLSKFTMPRAPTPPKPSQDPEVVFSFALVGDRSLDVLSTDAMRLQHVLTLCQFHKISPEDMHRRFASASVRGGLSKVCCFCLIYIYIATGAVRANVSVFFSSTRQPIIIVGKL